MVQSEELGHILPIQNQCLEHNLDYHHQSFQHLIMLYSIWLIMMSPCVVGVSIGHLMVVVIIGHLVDGFGNNWPLADNG